jgi:hypothetical protein
VGELSVDKKTDETSIEIKYIDSKFIIELEFASEMEKS